MAGNLDIQRDHVSLIQAAMARLSDDGLLIFSTNRKGLKLDPVLHEQFSIEERTAWSIPKDFQRPGWVHGCWFIRS
jgi:23S rRNA (guanine2445-N2)-methyltransferase / 23S rRNA (guanine2069-N7)-methyltransferase